MLKGILKWFEIYLALLYFALCWVAETRVNPVLPNENLVLIDNCYLWFFFPKLAQSCANFPELLSSLFIYYFYISGSLQTSKMFRVGPWTVFRWRKWHIDQLAEVWKQDPPGPSVAGAQRRLQKVSPSFVSKDLVWWDQTLEIIFHYQWNLFRNDHTKGYWQALGKSRNKPWRGSCATRSWIYYSR